MTTTALDDDLRERFADPASPAAALRAAREELRVRRAADDGGPVARSHVGRALQRLSETCRCAGELDESLALKDETLEIWAELGKVRAHFLVRLQRALVLAELGDDRAEAAMAGLGEEVEDPRLAPYYRDFWLEYEARRLLWSGDRAGAVERLREALELRRATRSERIVRWTQEALVRLGHGESV